MTRPIPELPDTIRPVRWQDDHLVLLDQRRLPDESIDLHLTDVVATGQAIRDMVVRGAPAIGITAAYGMVLAARRRYQVDAGGWLAALVGDGRQLAAARPTAVNLAWAVERLLATARGVAAGADPVPVLLAEADRILAEDIAANRTMARLGAALLGQGVRILTHCNAGALATGGIGTALGVVRQAQVEGRLAKVYAGETRPWLQGARLTAWELLRDGIPVTLVAEGAAAWLMAQGHVDWVIVGADRVAANGDVANKIGTYSLAVLARQHGVRTMVVAPTSTLDRSLAAGAQIPIESRAAEEVLDCGGRRLAAAGASAWNPVFDVTPAALVDALVTEKGVCQPPSPAALAALGAR
ncbi:MAG: S-methyl-5-thioribose-1-phosphate isomerase [Thermodesulfobacteriota bacterium]